MTKPLQYQSQYIPTDFGQVSQLAQLYNQDIDARNQEYNQALNMEQGMLAQLAQAQTSDPNMKQQLMDSFSERIKEIVDKKGGDYGAAAADIGSLVAKERSNKWYQYDANKLAKIQEEAKLKQQLGINYYSPKNASDISYEDYLADSNIFNSYQPTNLQPALQEIAQRAKAESSLKTQDILRDSGIPYYKEYGTITGYNTPEERNSFIESEAGQNIVNEMVQMFGMDTPEIRQKFKNELYQNLGGTEDINLIQDQEKLLQSRTTTKGEKIELPQFNVYKNLDIKEYTEKIKSNISNLRSGIKNGKMDSSIIPKEEKMFDPFVEGVVFDFMDEMQYLGEDIWDFGLDVLNMENDEKEHSKYWEQGPTKARQNRKINKYEILKDAYKKKYSNVYTSSKNDEDFLDKVEKLEIANSALKGSELSLADPSLAKNLFVAIKEIPHKKNKAKTFVNKDTGKSISRKEAETRLGSAPLQIRVNSEGMLTVAIPNNGGDRYEDYVINPEALPVGISKSDDNNSIKEISDIFNKYNITDKEIEDINNTVYKLNSSPYYYRVKINPTNPLNKEFVKIVGKDNNNNLIEEPATLSELQYLNTVNTFKTIKAE